MTSIKQTVERLVYQNKIGKLDSLDAQNLLKLSQELHRRLEVAEVAIVHAHSVCSKRYDYDQAVASVADKSKQALDTLQAPWEG